MKAKRQNPAEPPDSNRLYCIAQVSGTSKEKKEIALTLDKGAITLDVCNFGVEEKERQVLVSVEITNIQALKRFRAMLDIAIKTI